MNASRLCRILGLGCIALWLLAPVGAQQGKKSDLDDLIDAAGKGTRFRLVAYDRPRENLAERLYWRRQFAEVAASTTPVRFRCGDVDVIARRRPAGRKRPRMTAARSIRSKGPARWPMASTC